MLPAPSPFHYLRSHHAPLSATHFDPSNTLLYSGDQDGYVSILDLRVRRVIAYWKAHEGGVLGLEEWEGGLISHGRDNVIHFYEPLRKPYISSGLGGEKNGPPILKSLPTNALNFCRFSMCAIPPSGRTGESSSHVDDDTDRQPVPSTSAKGKGKEREAVLAVPSLMDSELVDIYHLPSMRRVHASINHVPKASRPVSDSVIPNNTREGLVMSLQLQYIASKGNLALGIGYEDGRAELHTAPLGSIGTGFDPRMTKGANPWTNAWAGKGHNEAIMGMAVDRRMRYGWSVSADHRLVRYDFGKVLEGGVAHDDVNIMKDCAMKQIGNSCVAVNADGRVVAVGGWDGKIRLFSAETFKPLGTLASHRGTVHALAFANHAHSLDLQVGDRGTAAGGEEEEASTLDLAESDSDSDEETGAGDGVPPRDRWLASGGKDTKIALWGLMDFAAASTAASVESSSG